MSTELSHPVKALPTKGPWQNKKAFLALPLAMLLLGGCGFGFGTAAPTPEPFNAPAYQPSVTATPIPPAEPATEVVTQTAALPASQAPAQAANALPQAATGDNGQWIYTGEI